jgi:hypothetical protein
MADSAQVGLARSGSHRRRQKSGFIAAVEQTAWRTGTLKAAGYTDDALALVDGWEAEILRHPILTVEDAIAAIDYALLAFFGTKQTRYCLTQARKVIKREIRQRRARS